MAVERTGIVAATLTAAALTGSCITPSVLERSEREVKAPEEELASLAWHDAARDELLGLFESIAIEGEVAGSLWRVWYHFASDGTYSGAALVLGGVDPEFQTLSGTWSLDGGALDLGQGQVVRVQAADSHLRMESEGGAVIFRACEVR
jgi:hypothetical protein